MPMAIPLLVAGAQAVAAGSVVAGLAAAGAGSALLGGLVVAGSALSTLGMITGNQKLSKVGGVLGLVGGVGALANGLANAATQNLAEQAAKTSFRDIELGRNLSQTVTPVADGAAQATAASTGVLESGSEALAQAASNAPTEAALNAAASNPAVAVNGPTAAAAQTASASPIAQGADTAAAGAANGPAAGGGSFLDKMKTAGKFVKDNKELVNFGGGLLAGAMEDTSRQRQLQQQFDLETRMRQQKRDEYNASLRGLRAPVYQAPKG